MTRRTTSSSWSRPATGKQIAALKAHGNYDNKYYSMGRASKAIAGSVEQGWLPLSGASSGHASRPRGEPSHYRPSSLLAQLLDVSDDVVSVVSAVVDHASRGEPSLRDGHTSVESVALTVGLDESDPSEPRIVFAADVARARDYAGEPTLTVRFVSNVNFGEPPPSTARGFISGVRFDA